MTVEKQANGQVGAQTSVISSVHPSLETMSWQSIADLAEAIWPRADGTPVQQLQAARLARLAPIIGVWGQQFGFKRDHATSSAFFAVAITPPAVADAETLLVAQLIVWFYAFDSLLDSNPRAWTNDPDWLDRVYASCLWPILSRYREMGARYLPPSSLPTPTASKSPTSSLLPLPTGSSRPANETDKSEATSVRANAGLLPGEGRELDGPAQERHEEQMLSPEAANLRAALEDVWSQIESLADTLGAGEARRSGPDGGVGEMGDTGDLRETMPIALRSGRASHPSPTNLTPSAPALVARCLITAAAMMRQELLWTAHWLEMAPPLAPSLDLGGQNNQSSLGVSPGLSWEATEVRSRDERPERNTPSALPPVTLDGYLAVAQLTTGVHPVLALLCLHRLHALAPGDGARLESMLESIWTAVEPVIDAAARVVRLANDAYTAPQDIAAPRVTATTILYRTLSQSEAGQAGKRGGAQGEQGEQGEQVRLDEVLTALQSEIEQALAQYRAGRQTFATTPSYPADLRDFLLYALDHVIAVSLKAYLPALLPPT